MGWPKSPFGFLCNILYTLIHLRKPLSEKMRAPGSSHIVISKRKLLIKIKDVRRYISMWLEGYFMRKPSFPGNC